MTRKEKPLLPEGVTGPLTRRFRYAESLVISDPQKAYEELLKIILTDTSLTNVHPGTSEEVKSSTELAEDTFDEKEMVDDIVEGESTELEEEDPARVKEASIYALGKIDVDGGSIENAKQTFENIRPFFLTIPKARTAKIVRNFIDLLSSTYNASSVQEQLCLETIEWCRKEKRTFLRHRIQSRLALLYHQQKRYANSLSLIDELLKEIKKLDDKLLLVEVHCIEAKVYFSIHNLPKAKAALTAARSNSNAIHCPPLVQADIDTLAGALQLEDNDASTAFSYFVEAFEAFHLSGNSQQALATLKYALLSKILLDHPQDVASMVAQRQYLPYAGEASEAFVAVAKCCINRDLKMFEECLKKYTNELENDPIISRHTHKLYQTLLEQNILKVLKPFSRVQLWYVAERIDLPFNTVQEKLSQMILDKQLAGTLDQESGVLELFEEEQIPSVYDDSIVIFENLSSVIDILYSKSQKVL